MCPFLLAVQDARARYGVLKVRGRRQERRIHLERWTVPQGAGLPRAKRALRAAQSAHSRAGIRGTVYLRHMRTRDRLPIEGPDGPR